MTSRNSFSNGGLLRDGVRRNLWGTVLSAITFLLTLLLPALMVMQQALEEKRQIAAGVDGLFYSDADAQWQSALDAVGAVLGVTNSFVKLALIALAVVCGVTAFSYLHARQKVDFYHSLPISRSRLFANNFATGLLSVLPSYLIVLGLTLVCVYAMGFGQAVDWVMIGSAIGCNLIFFLIIYALSVLAAVLCGNTVVSLLLLLWLQFGAAAAGWLSIAVIDKFSTTFSEVGVFGKLARLSPPIEIFVIHSGTESGSRVGLLVAYLLAAVLISALGWLLFCRRKSERAGAALAFEPAKLPVKVVMCMIAGTAVALAFHYVVGAFWFWPGLVIGTVLFHWLIEIIYAFDFRAIFAKPVQLLAILAVLIGLMLGCQADVFGYNRWLPDQGKIEAVDVQIDGEPALATAENIASVYRLAEIGVASLNQELEGTDTRHLWLSFRMRGGRVVGRTYVVENTDEVDRLYDQICSSEEYKRAKWAIFTYDPAAETDRNGAPLGIIRVTNEVASVGEIGQSEQVAAILETLRAEVLERPAGARPALVLDLQYRDRGGSGYSRYSGQAIVTQADVQTLALIEQYCGIREERLQADDLAYIEIGYFSDEAGTETVEVTDPADMEALLRDAINLDIVPYTEERRSGRELAALDGYIYAHTKMRRGDYALGYLEGSMPTAILEKYRPAGSDAIDAEDWELPA